MKPAGRERAELSRERILAAALELIDQRGLAALNMRDLGRALGASTMGVYRHFRNKSDLLGAVVDSILETFAPQENQGDWRAQAKAMSLRVRGAMLAHPELADLIGREFRRSPTSFRVNALMIDRLRGAGVPDALLPDAFWAIASYTNGYALLEAQTLRRRRGSAGSGSGPDRVRKLAAMFEGVEDLDPDVSRAAAAVLARPINDAQFEFGLACLIRGIEDRIRAAGGQSEA
ncbi:MAG: TetR/AcrR family transcriptional regulator [Pseudomonadota bacterium]